ncbi:hypothetical protein [Streptomyces sp. NPDC126514]|uniref:hypothetical protein n=1 Tax=Streptomyces sp. NPDC126514 TaxID=3155210 RepID=UPI0033255CF3
MPTGPPAIVRHPLASSANSATRATAAVTSTVFFLMPMIKARPRAGRQRAATQARCALVLIPG